MKNHKAFAHDAEGLGMLVEVEAAKREPGHRSDICTSVEIQGRSTNSSRLLVG